MMAGAVGGSLTVFVLVGCSSGAPAAHMSPTAGAVGVCLIEVEQQFAFSIDDGVAIGVEVDEQGW